MSNSASSNNSLIDLDDPLFTHKKLGKGLKILTHKQIFQRLAAALLQVKAVNASGNLLKEIKHTVYTFYQAKQITKEVCNYIFKSI